MNNPLSNIFTDNVVTRLSETIPEVKKAVNDIDAVVNESVKPLLDGEVKQTLTSANTLLADIQQKLRFAPLVIACLCVIALAAVCTTAGVVVLLVR